jgi:hypothetical protein
MRKPGTLDTFDKTGVVVVTILGTGIGLIVALGSDVRLIPFVVICPGLVIAYPAAKLFGPTVSIVLTAIANGAIYGFLLYAWDRLADKLSNKLRTMKPSQR